MKPKKYFYFNYKFLLNFLKDSQTFLYVICLIFLISIFLGSAFSTPEVFEKMILEFISELMELTKNLSWVEMISFIFFNNLKSSFFGFVSGIGLGLVSLFSTFINGYLIGFVVKQSVLSSGVFVLWRLFPHGIFELPAVLISFTLGLRISIEPIKLYFKKQKVSDNLSLVYSFVLILILPLISTLLFLILNLRDDKLSKKYLEILLDSFNIFIFLIIPLLFVAAIIEGSLIFLI